jgi:hypothetical protein
MKYVCGEGENIGNNVEMASESSKWRGGHIKQWHGAPGVKMAAGASAENRNWASIENAARTIACRGVLTRKRACAQADVTWRTRGCARLPAALQRLRSRASRRWRGVC